MALQDSFYIGFDLEGRHYALPTKWVFQVFYHPHGPSSSQLLKLDELVVFEGEPYYLRLPNKLLTTGDGADLEQGQSPIKGVSASWVMVLKNQAEDQVSGQKGLGFRVQQVTPPFEVELDDESVSVNDINHAGIQYQCLLLKEQS